jgi:hypothetical protein
MPRVCDRTPSLRCAHASPDPRAQDGAKVAKLGTHPPCRRVVFAPDSERIVCAAADGSVDVRNVRGGDEARVHVFDAHRGAGTCVLALVVSRDGQWAASGASDGTVLVYSLDALRTAAVLQLGVPVLALAFCGGDTLLAAVTATHEVLLLNVELAAVAPASREVAASLPAALRSRADCVLGAAARGASLLLWGASWVCRLDLPLSAADSATHADAGKRKRTAAGPSDTERGSSKKAATKGGKATPAPEPASSGAKLVDRLGPLLCADYGGAAELVLAERPWVHVLAALPDVLDRPRFGT